MFSVVYPTHRSSVIRSAVALLLGLFVLTSSADTMPLPKHRYSFNGDAVDSVGGADGTLRGFAGIENGALVLNGTNGYAELPGTLLQQLASATVETWFVQDTAPETTTFPPPQAPWLYYLGTSNPLQYRLGQVASQGSTPTSIPVPQLSTGVVHHVVWTQDYSNQIARIYIDGILQGEKTPYTLQAQASSGTFRLGGGGLTSGVLPGKILEFRIYPTALSIYQVAASRTTGPEELFEGEVPPVGSLDAAYVAPVPVGAIQQLTITGMLSNLVDIPLTGSKEVFYGSSDLGVVQVSETGRLTATGVGSAMVTVSLGDAIQTVPIRVFPAEEAGLAHRYNFEEPSASLILTDLIGQAHGVVAATGGNVFTNGGRLWLGGSGYVTLPNGIVSHEQEVTIEAWISHQNGTSSFWPRVFDFGTNTANYFFLSHYIAGDNVSTKRNFLRATISTNSILGETPKLDAPTNAPFGENTHLVVTYSPSKHLAKLYVDGVCVSSGDAVIPLSALQDTRNFLGRSQWPGDTNFRGFFDEFRIHREFLSDSEVAASYAAGPEVIGSDYALRTEESAAGLEISWGPTVEGAELEFSSTVGESADWKPVEAEAVFVEGRYRVTVPKSSPSLFYRLAQAP